MNKLILIGNLTDAPEDKGSFYTFSVATNKSYKKDGEWKQITQFHNCIMNKRYEINYSKGDLVALEGEVTYKKTDKGTFTNISVDRIKKLIKSESKPDYSQTKKNDFDDGVPF